jgi:hypothetical protein
MTLPVCPECDGRGVSRAWWDWGGTVGTQPLPCLVCGGSGFYEPATGDSYKAPNRKGVSHQEHCLHDEPGVTICTCQPRDTGDSE